MHQNTNRFELAYKWHTFLLWEDNSSYKKGDYILILEIVFDGVTVLMLIVCRKRSTDSCAIFQIPQP